MASETKIENSRRLLLALAECLGDAGVAYFVDSGSLLGIVRDGDLISYDTDIDVGVLAPELPRLLQRLPDLRARGIEVRVRSYRGRTHVVSLTWRWRRSLSLHAHVYARAGEFWWSPQIVKHLKWPGTIAAIRSARRHVAGGAAGRSGEAPHLSAWRDRVFSRVALPTFPLYTLGEVAMRSRGRVDRAEWVRSRAGRLLYSSFTWVVPAAFLEAFDEIDWRGGTLRVPRDPERYLAFRYGDDWRTRKPEWIYFLDDRSIFCEAPESLVPRLDRAPSSPASATGALRPARRAARPAPAGSPSDSPRPPRDAP